MNPQFFDQYRVQIVNKIADKLEYAPALKPGPIARLFRKEDPNAERAVTLHHDIRELLVALLKAHTDEPLYSDEKQDLLNGVLKDAITLFRSRNPQPK